MGEEPWRVLVSGEPGLDAIYRVDFLTREALEADLRTPLGRNTALVTFHPTTRELDDLDSQIEEFVSALGATDLRFIMTAPNADAGGLRILAALQAFTAAHPDRATFVPSLGHRRYLSLLKIVGLVIGNSSSGLVEAPSFNVPVVNIGTRQAGRPQAANVFQTGYSRSSIADGIARARAYAGPPPVNPFGDGHASARIHEFLRRVLETKTRDEVLRKKFVTR